VESQIPDGPALSFPPAAPVIRGVVALAESLAIVWSRRLPIFRR